MPTPRNSWKNLEVANDETHHTIRGCPAYSERFTKVLKFHAPGFAPVENQTGAFHIDTMGKDIYPERYLRTFGFYHFRAAVVDKDGWFHLTTSGKALYGDRYAWVGNFQEKLCTVRNYRGAYFHLNQEGQKAYEDSFDFAGDFKDGYAVVQNKHGLSTHINREGEFLHGVWLADLDVFHKGFARAKDSRGWFHINKLGKQLYTDRYKNIEPFYNGFSRAESFDGAIAMIDETGAVTHGLRKSQRDSFHIASAELISYWRLYTLYCAHDMKLFDCLPTTSSDIAKSLSFPVESVIRLLTALQEMRLVIRKDNDNYEATEVGAYFCVHHPYSLTKALQFWRDEHHTSWLDLHDSLKTGKNAFEKQNAIDWFSWLRNHPDKNMFFHDVMENYARRDYQKISSLLNMDKHRTVLDLGGSTGSLLIQLLNDNSHLDGILLDLPEIIEKIHLQDSLCARIRMIGSDFFEMWPTFTADAIFLARILHDWSDSEAISILKKAHAVLANSSLSRIYVIENLLDPLTGFGGLLDLNMLVMTQGKERTLDQYESLFEVADLVLERRIPLNEVTNVLIIKKK